MPSVSEAQKKFMNIAAHSKEFADKAGIDQKSAKEWHNEDKKHPNKKLPKKAKSTQESLVYLWSST